MKKKDRGERGSYSVTTRGESNSGTTDSQDGREGVERTFSGTTGLQDGREGNRGSYLGIIDLQDRGERGSYSATTGGESDSGTTDS